MTYFDAHNYVKRMYHGGGDPYMLLISSLKKASASGGVKVVCDTATSRTFRKSIHPGYKQGRHTDDDKTYFEIYKFCIDIATHFPNTTVVNVNDAEADDYIVTHAKKGDTVISNDKDLWVLTGKSVTVKLNASANVATDLLLQKFDTANPFHIYLYKALVGDSSDKIPGMRGYGPAKWHGMAEAERNKNYEMFKVGDFGNWPDQVKMSWKLARHYVPQDFTTLPSRNFDDLERFLVDAEVHFDHSWLYGKDDDDCR